VRNDWRYETFPESRPDRIRSRTLDDGCCGRSITDNAPLTNAAIVKLVRSGFKEKTVISIVAARRAAYDLSPDRMIELKKSGVSESYSCNAGASGGLQRLGRCFHRRSFFRDSSRKQKESQKSGTTDTAPTFLAQVEADQSSTRTGAEAQSVQRYGNDGKCHGANHPASQRIRDVGEA